jgi:hypothetical protein
MIKVVQPEHFLARLAVVALLLLGCAGAPAPDGAPAVALRFVSAFEMTRQGDGLAGSFGGISGIDHDARSGIWYLLSDDRGEFAPAPRAYTADITAGAHPFSVRLRGRIVWRGPAGLVERPDPEALRVLPDGRGVLWASEADCERGEAPLLRESHFDGTFVRDWPLPAALRCGDEPGRGPRPNRNLEGLAFTPQGRLWIAMEAPLFEDGPLPTRDAGAPVRMTLLAPDGALLGQYAYVVDPIRRDPTGGRLRADNGVSEVVALDEDTLLVVERTGFETAPSSFSFDVRLYEARREGASDVSRLPSLAGTPWRPMRKRLVLDLARAGLAHVGNIEAAALGPPGPGGGRTLVLAADDNFAPGQKNQFLLFEVSR